MTPENEKDLAAMVADTTGPLRVQGGGTRALPGDAPVLRTAGLTGIELYEPGALTIVVKAGTPVAEVEAALAAENQRLPFEPVDYRDLMSTTGTPTIGSVVATNNSGSRRIQVGAARDFALGVRYVDGMGQIVKNGGRVMKNVTGYDLVKLMSGSWGTLGVMSEVSLKVLPMPETEASVIVHGLSPAQAVAAMSSALGSPYDVSGAAHAGPSDAPATAIRVEGFAASVAYRVDQLKALLAPFDAEISVSADSAGLWAGISAAQDFNDLPGDVWRVSVKPSDGPAVVNAAGALQARMDWAGGLVWLLTEPGTDLRARLSAIAGHATLVRGAADLPRFHPEAPGVAQLSQGLRQRFDPRGILNPGLMAA